jgi:hypothetical protein
MTNYHLWSVVVPLVAAAGLGTLGVLIAVYLGFALD